MKYFGEQESQVESNEALAKNLPLTFFLMFNISLPLDDSTYTFSKVTPVSYTHLDVYKRQSLACPIATPIAAWRSIVISFPPSPNAIVR